MGELIIGEVQMVLWKLGQPGEFKKMSHKVGSRKSPERVGLLRTSAGGILYPTLFIFSFLFVSIFSPFFFHFRFFLPLPHLIPHPNHPLDEFYAIWGTPYIRDEGHHTRHQGMPTLGIPSSIHAHINFFTYNPKHQGME